MLPTDFCLSDLDALGDPNWLSFKEGVCEKSFLTFIPYIPLSTAALVKVPKCLVKKFLYRPDDILIRQDDILLRPDELLYRSDELVYRPDEYISCGQ